MKSVCYIFHSTAIIRITQVSYSKQLLEFELSFLKRRRTIVGHGQATRSAVIIDFVIRLKPRHAVIT